MDNTLDRINETWQLCQTLVACGKKIAAHRGVSDSELEHIYARGEASYLAGDYSDALIDFVYLIMHCPGEHRFQLMMGWTLHRLQQHQHALKFFRYALL